MIEVLDILWFVLRFRESDTSCLLKVNRVLLICLFFFQHDRVLCSLNLSNTIIFEKEMSGSIFDEYFQY